MATVLNNDVKDEVVEEIDKMHKREVNSIQTSLREDFNTEAQVGLLKNFFEFRTKLIFSL